MSIAIVGRERACDAAVFVVRGKQRYVVPCVCLALEADALCALHRAECARQFVAEEEKPYRGLMIDCDLDVEQMNRLNAVTGIYVVSTCAGHPDRAGEERPWFNFNCETGGATAEATAEHLAAALRSDDTDVTTTYWRGPHGGWVTHVNGIARLDTFTPEQIEKHSTASATVHVDSKLANSGLNAVALHAWWDSTISRLESACGETR
jgi:hypothetical protein